MARRVSPHHQYVWRAVVTRTYPNGKQQSTVCGIFTGRGHATNSGNQEAAWGDHPVTVTLQRSPLAWEDYEPKGST